MNILINRPELIDSKRTFTTDGKKVFAKKTVCYRVLEKTVNGVKDLGLIPVSQVIETTK